ncbi:Pre-mRNA-splicing factor Cwf15/Cwc15 [Elsinoe ampelina]|uniref:Pre-mRNA-splicing factor Cwf15/Cwc15 n=1 Tax=Elsinoe ampelina TaxID=302913 RepID=A0A6A6FZL8_9PEZI|nr:Pre-mRNA-splicing factor Cwf15/Cwc15 [Elsinoe ampelina]
MTTAHRPTFDPARGKDAARGPAYHQRLLPAHKTLKYRQANQGTTSETARRDLRAELLRKEKRHYASKSGIEYTSSDDDEDVPRAKRNHDTANGSDAGREVVDEEEESYEAKRARVLAETKDLDASSSGSGSDDSSSDSDDDDDDDDSEAALMAELARIKKERADAAAKEAAEKAKLDEEEREKEIAYGNPLLNPKSEEYGVKRRWDDDVVFKNQARGQGEREKKGKEFVNDLLRSDFHKRFMGRYVR